MAVPLTLLLLQEVDHHNGRCENPWLGLRESVAADRLVSARPKERPAADSPSAEPTRRWCGDRGKDRVNVTGKSTRADRPHPSWALGSGSTEAATGWRRRTSPSHPAVPMGDH